MNVVRDPANDDRRRIQVSAGTGQIGMGSRTEFAVKKEWSTKLCREYHVQVNLSERLGHGATSFAGYLERESFLDQ
jgi:hypothetical protein